MSFLEAIPDIDGYHSDVDENCSAVAYIVPRHKKTDGTDCISSSVIREHDLTVSSEENTDSLHRTYLCRCGKEFDVLVFDSPENIRN